MLQLSPTPEMASRAFLDSTPPVAHELRVPDRGQVVTEKKPRNWRKSVPVLCGLTLAALAGAVAALVLLPVVLVSVLFFLPALLPFLLVIGGIALTGNR